MRKDLHRPPHLCLDNTIYFITASTAKKERIIEGAKLTAFVSLLLEVMKFYGFELMGWVILREHYHLLLRITKGLELPDFMRSFHGKSAFLFNKMDNLAGRKIWYQYWDRCISDEDSMYRRLNYIHNNPIKHGYVKDLIDYRYSSYNSYLEKFGREWLNDLWRKYPVIDYSEEDVFNAG
jgi:putative transposase